MVVVPRGALLILNCRMGLRADFRWRVIDFEEPGTCTDFVFLGMGGWGGSERRGNVNCKLIDQLCGCGSWDGSRRSITGTRIANVSGSKTWSDCSFTARASRVARKDFVKESSVILDLFKVDIQEEG
jgi:hypothetical protein